MYKINLKKYIKNKNPSSTIFDSKEGERWKGAFLSLPKGTGDAEDARRFPRAEKSTAKVLFQEIKS